VLILNEGTADLDAENEILDTLKALDITRIAVAHRPATLEATERVIEVEAGQTRSRTSTQSLNQSMGGAGPISNRI